MEALSDLLASYVVVFQDQRITNATLAKPKAEIISDDLDNLQRLIKYSAFIVIEGAATLKQTKHIVETATREIVTYEFTWSSQASFSSMGHPTLIECKNIDLEDWNWDDTAIPTDVLDAYRNILFADREWIGADLLEWFEEDDIIDLEVFPKVFRDILLESLSAARENY